MLGYPAQVRLLCWPGGTPPQTPPFTGGSAPRAPWGPLKGARTQYPLEAAVSPGGMRTTARLEAGEWVV